MRSWCLLILAWCWLAAPLRGQSELWNRIPHGPWVMEVRVGPGELLQVLARDFDLWSYDRKNGLAVIGADGEALRRLEQLGLDYRLDHELTAQMHERFTGTPGGTTIPGFSCYDTVEGSLARIQNWQSQYPNLVEVQDIGDSWQKQENAENGYDLVVCRLSNRSVSGHKPKIFILSGLHARELATVGLSTRFAEELLTGYETNPDATWILDHTEIHLLFQANPDGRKQAEGGDWWRKNEDRDFCPSSTPGVDLNRNFSFMWGCCGGSSTSACSETYRGPTAGSEPESSVVMNYLTSIFPDQRGPDLSDPAPDDATGVFIDIHSYGGYVLWPYGFSSMVQTPNLAQLQRLGRKFAFFNDYSPELASQSFTTDGTTDDFSYGTLGIAAYTFEIGNTFFQSCTSFEASVVPDNLPALIYAAKVARAPYILPLGPDLINLSEHQGNVLSTDLFEVTLRADDTRYSLNNSSGSNPGESSQAIAAVGLWAQMPPWEAQNDPDWWGSAVDGTFDSTAEDVRITVDASVLGPGRKLLYVAAKDADGNWGVPKATFVDVIAAGSLAQVSGQVREAHTFMPLDANLRFNAQFAQAQAGSFSALVPAGSVLLEVTAPGYAMQQMNLNLGEGEAVELDIELVPECSLFEDGFEVGTAGWSGGAGWSLTAAGASSGAFGWEYAPTTEPFETLISPWFDLSELWAVGTAFHAKRNFSSSIESVQLLYSFDEQSWFEIWREFGASSGWSEVQTLPFSVEGHDCVRFLFLVQAPTSSRFYLDDLRILGSGSRCYAPDAYLQLTEDWPNAVSVLHFIPVLHR